MKPQEQLANLETLEKFWATIPSGTVSLYRYHQVVGGCGTLYCIGGHIAHSGLFGVVAVAGEPVMHYGDMGERRYGFEVAAHLFGDESLFDRRGEHQADSDCPENASDYEVAAHRIRWAKAQLQEELA